MRKFLRIFCCLCWMFLFTCCVSNDARAQSDIINDGYTRYAEVFGNDYEISELIETFSTISNYSIHNSSFMFKSDEYSIRVPQIVTDGYTLFVNIELTIDAASGIVRPYEFSLQNSQYYTPIEYYNVPVYFFSANVSFDSTFDGRAGNWGITNDNRTMNRLEFQTGAHDDYKTNADGTVDVYFLITIIKPDEDWKKDELSFVLACPITKLH